MAGYGWCGCLRAFLTRLNCSQRSSGNAAAHSFRKSDTLTPVTIVPVCRKSLHQPPTAAAATTPATIVHLLPMSSCSHARDPRGHAAPAPTRRPAVDTDAARRGKADLVRGGVEAVLVVDRSQDLVDVGLEHHAAHDDLVEDIVNLPEGG